MYAPTNDDWTTTTKSLHINYGAQPRVLPNGSSVTKSDLLESLQQDQERRFALESNAYGSTDQGLNRDLSPDKKKEIYKSYQDRSVYHQVIIDPAPFDDTTNYNQQFINRPHAKPAVRKITTFAGNETGTNQRAVKKELQTSEIYKSQFSIGENTTKHWQTSHTQQFRNAKDVPTRASPLANSSRVKTRTQPETYNIINGATKQNSDHCSFERYAGNRANIARKTTRSGISGLDQANTIYDPLFGNVHLSNPNPRVSEQKQKATTSTSSNHYFDSRATSSAGSRPQTHSRLVEDLPQRRHIEPKKTVIYDVITGQPKYELQM